MDTTHCNKLEPEMYGKLVLLALKQKQYQKYTLN